MSKLGLGADGGGQDGGNVKLRERVFQVPQGISADLIGTLHGFTREQIDDVALRSQRNAAVAVEEGRFNTSLVPVHDPATSKLLLDREEFPRPDTTKEGLAALKPSFVALGEMAVGPSGETLDQIALAAYPQAKVIQHLHRRELQRDRRRRGGGGGGVGGLHQAHGIRPRARSRGGDARH